MSERTTRYLFFSTAAIVIFMLIFNGFAVLAQIRIGGKSFAESLNHTVHYSVVQPVGTLISFFPFAAVTWICASLAKESRGRAIWLMAICLALFALMYYFGQINSQKFMQQHLWTAATLSVGLIPFKSIPIVILAFVLRFVWGRNHGPTAA